MYWKILPGDGEVARAKRVMEGLRARHGPSAPAGHLPVRGGL